MDALNTISVNTPHGVKSLSVHCCDICTWHDPIDVMTISAFQRDYLPVQNTLLGALQKQGISVEILAKDPAIDLRKLCNVWLSHEVRGAGLPISRIGCIEMVPLSAVQQPADLESSILSSIQAYFHMLDIATCAGIRVESLGLPVLGGGNQHVATELICIPVLNECLSFLTRNASVRDIHIITRNQGQAYQFARALETSYSFAQRSTQADVALPNGANRPAGKLAFISYSSVDKNVADNLCAKLESHGIKAWYAPRDIRTGDYASSIVEAIGRCTHFVVIVGQHSLKSQHVLNEIDLAFQRLGKGVKFCPLKIDEEEMGPAFTYYLSRQHWMDACVPPLEQRLEEFVDRLYDE